jgi:Papain family cysteine protease
VWEYAKDQSGLVKETSFEPYNANASYPCVAGKARDSRSVVDYWSNIKSQDEDEMMCYVALYGPLHVSIYVGNTSLKNYKSGIWDDPENNCPTDGSITHSMGLVGFGTEKSQTGELMDYWLLQNRLNTCCFELFIIKVHNCFSWGSNWGVNGFVKIKRGVNLCSVNQDAMYPKLKTAVPKPLKPIYTPTDCDFMKNVYSSAGVYLKSLCIDGYARTYEDSRVNCLTRGMRLYKAISPEAISVVLDVADINWTSNSWYVSLHIYENATGPLFVSNVNPSGMSEITIGNRTAYKRSVCEYIEKSCKLRLFYIEHNSKNLFLQCKKRLVIVL